MRRFIAAAFLIIPLTLCASEPWREKDIMKTELAREGVLASFKPGGDWLQLPSYHDREGWDAIFGDTAPYYISLAERYKDYHWQHIPASAYLAFERTGNRVVMENIEGQNRTAFNFLTLGELAEGKGRFLDQIADGMYFASEMHNWTLSAHNNVYTGKRALPVHRFVDLASGRFGAMMSLAWHFFHKDIDPVIADDAKAAVMEHIVDSFLNPADDRFNHWKGATVANPRLNNWTPWCTADVILSVLLLEDDSERLAQAVEMSAVVMDRFLNYISPDGACEEGPSYWDASGGKTYDYVELMNLASGGAFDVFDNARLRRYGEYVSRQYIGDGWQTNFADAMGRGSVGPVCLWEYGHGFHSAELMNFAYSLLADRTNGRFNYPVATLGDGYRSVQTLAAVRQMRPAVDSLNAEVQKRSMDEVLHDLRKDVPLSTWYPQTEQCFLRNEAGWFLGAKGGYNAESHNHNDIGSCIFFMGNTPVLVDAGVGIYTRDTFVSSERYKIWTMRGDWHNLPAPNGVFQQFGRDYKAVDASCDTRRGVFSLDLRQAYPDSAGIKSYVRRYELAPKGKSLKITDTFSLKERTGADLMYFLVYGTVETVSSGLLRIVCQDGRRVRVSYPAEMTPSVEIKEIDDQKIQRVWGTRLCRITLTSPATKSLNGKYSVTFIEEK